MDHLIRYAPIAVAVLVACASQPAARAADPPSVIALDIGHSLANSGAVSARGVSGFEFNVGLARMVRNQLANQNIPVIVINPDGQVNDLRESTASARAGGATFLLSIHHDSVQPQYLEDGQWQGRAVRHSERFSGFSLFVSRLNPQFETSLRCASAMGAALRRAGLQPTGHHTEKIAGESKEWADQDNGVYRYDHLVVLKTATMPAVLLEAGLIVNRDDEEKLQSAPMRALIAGAVVSGLQDCGGIP